MEILIATLNAYWLFDNKAPLKRWGVKLPDGGLTEKIDLLASSIMSIGPEGGAGPDIIALQEVEGIITLDPLVKKLRELGSRIEHYYVSDTLDPFTGQNVAILSRFEASIQPVTRLDQRVIEYTDHRDRSKMGSLGKFLRVDLEISHDEIQFDDEGKEIFPQVISFYNLHLKSRRGSTEQTRFLRSAQAQLVRDVSRPRVEQGNSNSPSYTVILGDFNEELRTKPLDTLLGKRDNSYRLTPATEKLPIDDQWTYVFDGNRQQLDHILLSTFINQRMTQSGITRIDNNVSDHDAVWAVVNPFLKKNEL